MTKYRKIGTDQTCETLISANLRLIEIDIATEKNSRKRITKLKRLKEQKRFLVNDKTLKDTLLIINRLLELVGMQKRALEELVTCQESDPGVYETMAYNTLVKTNQMLGKL